MKLSNEIVTINASDKTKIKLTMTGNLWKDSGNS